MRDPGRNCFCAVLYGVFGSLGALCLFTWYTMAVFHERSQHPYSYPFSICAGLISLTICMTVFVVNVKYFAESKAKIKTVLAELGITLLTFAVFVFAWGYAWEFVGRILK